MKQQNYPPNYSVKNTNGTGIDPGGWMWNTHQLPQLYHFLWQVEMIKEKIWSTTLSTNDTTKSTTATNIISPKKISTKTILTTPKSYLDMYTIHLDFQSIWVDTGISR